jgi:hypothetical protein
MNSVPAPAETIDERQEERQQQKFILAKLDHYTYVFPSNSVLEILLLDRSKLLQLPYYNPALLGVVEHQSQVVPIVSMGRTVGNIPDSSGEILTVVRLKQNLGSLGGVGLVFDKTLGSCLAKDLPNDLLGELQGIAPTATDTDSYYRLFKSELIPDRLWQPIPWK